MRLFEHEGKKMLADAGIPIPEGILCSSISEVRGALKAIGMPVFFKAQVLQGGRGKAGLIQSVQDEETAVHKAQGLLNSGEEIKGILVEQAVRIEKELYLSVSIDPVESCALIIACSEGGMEIEVLALKHPEKIIKEKVPISQSLSGFHARTVAYELGLDIDLTKQLIKIVMALYDIFTNYGCELIEVNPLFVTTEGKLVAGDAKVIVDDGSLFKHPELLPQREHFDGEMEYKAYQEGIPYLQFQGEISLMCAGAGLTTTVFDLIHDAGGSVANYLEFGGPNYTKAGRAMELCLMNEPKVILIVTYGTIARADVIAEGVVKAIREFEPSIPIVTCIRGTNQEEAFKILGNAGIEPILDTEEAVRRAVRLSASLAESVK
jgi:succinyl-CoA synthetase beta subunit